MIGKTINELQVGDSAEFAKTVSESDIYLFAGVTGDMNPAHIDEEYAKHTHFQGRIAHGMLGAGFVSAILGTRLPGPGTIYLSQSLSFKAPVPIGTTITARVEVVELTVEKNRVRLKTTCTDQNGTVILDGEAVVLAPKAR